MMVASGSSSTKKQVTGKRGEDLAVSYLQTQGYEIVERNWRCTLGEIDIVARRSEVVVFVEVRTRHASTTESALESVGSQKQAKMTRLAYAYLTGRQLGKVDWRVDVVAVALPRAGDPVIEHVENALDW